MHFSLPLNRFFSQTKTYLSRFYIILIADRNAILCFGLPCPGFRNFIPRDRCHAQTGTALGTD